MGWVAGVDGCKAGWFVVMQHCQSGDLDWGIYSNVSEILEDPKSPLVIAIDVPIGLLEVARHGGRDCDIEARTLLGAPRASSVFPPPIRPILKCSSYSEAKAVSVASSPAGIGISQQCYGIIPKIREVDDFVTPNHQKIIKEVHPELCFREMSGGVPTVFAKKKKTGFDERTAIIKEHGLSYSPIIGQNSA